ncbi:MAG: SAM-dependent chlorinase/fluorinase [Sediminibacterium sp.]|nr:SAM-dependent chlorinase/fluorinase [Sediminibacterium sp.]
MAIVTLSTDIGLRDFTVGAMKGQILSAVPTVTLVDITHHLSQTNFPQAAYICKSAFLHYPPESIHLILVNVFEYPVTQLLLARYQQQWIICPDNGILTMITGDKPSELYTIDCTGTSTLLSITSRIAAILTDLFQHPTTLKLSPANKLIEKYPLRPTTGPDWMDGQILFIDHFENVVINITREEFEEHRKGRVFRFAFNRNEVIEHLSNNYASVGEIDKLAWFNSAGYLEIAIRHGNIAGLFGLQGFNDQMNANGYTSDSRILYQTVRVFFDNQ